MPCVDKDTKRVAAAAEKQGWHIEEGSKTYKFFPPDRTKPPVFIAKTPSAQNSLKKAISQMKRSGFRWPINTLTERRQTRKEIEDEGADDGPRVTVEQVDSILLSDERTRPY